MLWQFAPPKLNQLPLHVFTVLETPISHRPAFVDGGVLIYPKIDATELPIEYLPEPIVEAKFSFDDNRMCLRGKLSIRWSKLWYLVFVGERAEHWFHVYRINL